MLILKRNTMTHTPEPWEFTDRYFIKANEETICQFFNRYEEDYLFNEANANRIVACVNAMAGITDPQAFRDSVDELTELTKEAAEIIRKREERIKELEGQIDEMLEQD